MPEWPGLGGSSSRASGGDVIAQQVGRLAFDVDEKGLQQFNRGLEQAKTSSDGFGARAVALGNIMSDLASKAAGMAVDVVKSAVHMGKALVENFADSTTEIDRWSRRLGVTTTELQELSIIGGEGVPKALEKLREGLGELALRGSGPAETALGALGLRLQDLEGKGATDQFRTLADALQDLPSDAERTKVALELLGEEGAALLPHLGKGAAGVDAMVAKAHELGLVLDESAIAKGKEAKRAMKELDAEWQQASNTAATALAPVFTDLARGTAEWLDSNQELIEQDLPAFVELVVETGQDAIAWAVEFGEDVVYLSTEIGHLAESIEDGLVAAYEVAEPVISAVTTVIEAQVAALGTAVEWIESMVGRLEGARAIVAEIQTGLGLDDTPTTSTRGSSALEAENAARRRAQGIADHAYVDPSMPARKLDELARDVTQEPAVRAQAQRYLPAAIEREDAAFEAENVAYQQRVEQTKAKREREREAKERRKRAEAYRRKAKGGGGGTAGVDTRDAEARLGAEITALAEASGATAKARRAALVAAAKQLDEGAGDVVARQAAASVLTGKTGVDLSNQSADAALFGRLTQIGGADAARHATDGARFVTIDQSQHNTITVNVPEQVGGALTPDGAAEVFTTAVRRILSDDYRKIIERGEGALSP